MGDCEKVRRYIADYGTGNLDSGKTRWLAAHLAECRECSRELEALDDVLAMVESNIPIFEPPAGLWNGVYNRITTEPERRRFGSAIGHWFARPLRAAGMAAAAMALAAALIFGGVGRRDVREAAPVRMAANDEYVQGHVLYAGQAPLADRVSYLSVVAASESGGAK